MPKIEGREGYSINISVYRVVLPKILFELVRGNLKSGKNFRNEGLSEIVSIDSLRNGDKLCAWGTGAILGEYLGTELPNSDWVESKVIGTPRESFKEYLDEFSYEYPFN